MEMPTSTGVGTKYKVSNKDNDKSGEAGRPHFSGRKLVISLSNLVKLYFRKRKKPKKIKQMNKIISLVFHTGQIKKESHCVIIICHSHNLQFYLLLTADCDGFPKPVSKKQEL